MSSRPWPDLSVFFPIGKVSPAMPMAAFPNRHGHVVAGQDAQKEVGGTQQGFVEDGAPVPAVAPISIPRTSHFCKCEASGANAAPGHGRRRDVREPRALVGQRLVRGCSGASVPQRSHPVLQDCSGTSPAACASCRRPTAIDRWTSGSIEVSNWAISCRRGSVTRSTSRRPGSVSRCEPDARHGGPLGVTPDLCGLGDRRAVAPSVESPPQLPNRRPPPGNLSGRGTRRRARPLTGEDATDSTGAVSSGSENARTELPVACTLGPDDGQARLARWKALHASAVPVSRLVGHELEVRYRAAPGVRSELEELAIAEQSCCGFLDWRVSEDHGQPVLRVVAPGESIEGLAIVAAMFRTVETTGTFSH